MDTTSTLPSTYIFNTALWIVKLCTPTTTDKFLLLSPHHHHHYSSFVFPPPPPPPHFYCYPSSTTTTTTFLLFTLHHHHHISVVSLHHHHHRISIVFPNWEINAFLFSSALFFIKDGRWNCSTGRQFICLDISAVYLPTEEKTPLILTDPETWLFSDKSLGLCSYELAKEIDSRLCTFGTVRNKLCLQLTHRPFPSCLKPLFQNEAKFNAIDMKMIFFILMQIKLIAHANVFFLSFLFFFVRRKTSVSKRAGLTQA